MKTSVVGDSGVGNICSKKTYNQTFFVEIIYPFFIINGLNFFIIKTMTQLETEFQATIIFFTIIIILTLSEVVNRFFNFETCQKNIYNYIEMAFYIAVTSINC